MPSPIAHPAAAVPFTRAGLALSALVIGSVSPDLGYLVPFSNPYFMNTAPGLILFDVPLGLLLLWIFHAFAKWPLLSVAPDGLQRRLYGPAQGFTFGPPRRFALIVLSVLVGSATHVLWDSFTHEWGWMVEQFAILCVSLGGIAVFVILKNLSAVLGVCLLAYWFICWVPTAPQSDRLPPRFPTKLRVGFLAVVALSLTALEAATVFGGFEIGSHLIHEHGLVHGLTLEAGLVLSFYAVAYWLACTIAFGRVGPATGSPAGPLTP